MDIVCLLYALRNLKIQKNSLEYAMADKLKLLSKQDQSEFDFRYACCMNNHRGKQKVRKKNRRTARRRLKREFQREIDEE